MFNKWEGQVIRAFVSVAILTEHPVIQLVSQIDVNTPTCFARIR